MASGDDASLPLEQGEGEANRALSLLVAELVGVDELAPDIFRHRLVQLLLRLAEGVFDGAGPAFREQRLALHGHQLLLDHAAHDVGDVGDMDAVAGLALEPVAVEQGKEEMEVLVLAVVGRGRQEDELSGVGGQHLAQLEALGVLHLCPKVGGRHLVGLVHNDKVPIDGGQLVEDVLVAAELVEPGDAQVVFLEPVAGTRRREALVGEDLKGEVEPFLQLVLPLFNEAARGNDEATVHVTPDDEFLDEQPGHDGLSRAGIVGEQEAQGLAPQHGFIDGGDLVREGLDGGRVDGDVRVEEERVPQPLGLRDEPEGLGIGREGKGAALLNQRQALLLVAVQEFLARASLGIDEGDREDVVAVALDLPDGDRLSGPDAAHDRAHDDVLQLQHASMLPGKTRVEKRGLMQITCLRSQACFPTSSPRTDSRWNASPRSVQ